MSFKFFNFFILRQNEIKFVFERPNLSSALPVEIFLCVGALISGFSLIPIAIFFFKLLAILLTNTASFSDSIFINKIYFLIANLI